MDTYDQGYTLGTNGKVGSVTNAIETVQRLHDRIKTLQAEAGLYLELVAALKGYDSADCTCTHCTRARRVLRKLKDKAR